jgi:hypothetical protein
MLASAIGVLLMSALYVAVGLQLRHAQAGREVIQRTTLVRAVLARMSSDIASHMGPSLPAASAGSSSGAGGTAGGNAAGGGGTSAGGSGSNSGSSGAASSSTPAASSSPTTTTNAVQVNLGVQGDTQRIILSVSKVPRELQFGVASGSDQPQQVVADQRRITYWLVGNGDSPLGLARQEIKAVTSADLTAAVPPDVPDEGSFVIAEEVKSLTFSYFDGSSWQDTWDGTAPGSDGVTPQGPPLAIAITIGVAMPGRNGEQDDPNNMRLIRHVVAIPTANGASQASTTSQ